MIAKFVSPHNSKLEVVQDKDITKLMESLGSGSLSKQSPLMSEFASNKG